MSDKPHDPTGSPEWQALRLAAAGARGLLESLARMSRMPGGVVLTGGCGLVDQLERHAAELAKVVAATHLTPAQAAARRGSEGGAA